MADGAAAEFLESRNIFATPVLSVDGTLVIGFQKDRVDALLGISR
jgi:hypothetical protein